MFRRNAATLMNRLMVRSLVLVFAAIGRYLGTTWFSSAQFTSSGSLEARKKPHVIRAAQNHGQRASSGSTWTGLMKETRFDSSIGEGLTKHVRSRDEQEREATPADLESNTSRICLGGREPNKSPFPVSRPRLSQD